ncbi:glutathionylspermidine synthase family protein [Luteolibacter flavescens]|uniref:Glutathionylspermidine synthase family protein n=1 Tax=Luteolibacter flavescens TaxID=1859460 RepID=A0ABT3FLV8_9BACT|nr:glutathionylspermidine synthase family protein [Luteolibacter flavescens]MCW1884562.1 glutathionylspermidine synthase family protein [Luteolibacter flavescens]
MSAPIRLESRAPRPDWQRRVEEAGLLWHATDGQPYWTEDQSLVFTLDAAEELEAAANELHQLCLYACGEIVRRDWFGRLAIPDAAAGMVQASWMTGDRALYGRFDLAWDGTGKPKMLEYNSDTPTSLLEAAVIQWQWLEDVAPDGDQLNSIHEALVERWKIFPEQMIHFACVWDNLEDRQTIAYLAETAEQAGKSVELMDMGEIGFSEGGRFTDPSERSIERLFKLYPWEWMVEEPFFAEIGLERDRFTEPAWKMMLSNKGILPILWELNPGHPLLLPAYDSREALGEMDRWVEKPFFGREGSGVVLRSRGPFHSPPPIGPTVYQGHANLFEAAGRHVVWGLWMVGDECRGLSARGDTSPVTGNLSRFLPHRIA